MDVDFKSVCLFVFTTILMLFFLEGLLRLLDIQPYISQAPEIESRPSPSLVAHPQLGIALNPGKFEVTINKGLQYQCTHEKDSSRRTKSYYNKSNSKKTVIAIYGCSLTYGMGVSDSLTFPFLLQQNTNWDIRNYAVPAYGTLQSLLQFQAHLKKGIVPDRVILNYASLHDARNKLSPAQQKYWKASFSDQSSLDTAQFPRVTKLQSGALNIQYLPVREMKSHWKSSHHSALIKIIERTYDHILDGFQDKHLISQQIVLAFAKICQQNKIPLLITGISEDRTTHKMLAFCKKNNIPTLALGVDFRQKQYNLMPYDSHPNPAAHQQYADKLFSYLKNL